MSFEPTDALGARARAIAQHEFGHFVVSVALGYKPAGVSIHVPSLEAHRGKCWEAPRDRCETLEQVRDYLKRRIIILLAGAVSESLDSGTHQPDTNRAIALLRNGETGAGDDYARATELVALLHSTMPIDDEPLVGIEALLNQLFNHTVAIVVQNGQVISELAYSLCLLASTQTENLAALQYEGIAQMPSFKKIVCIQL